MMLEVQNLSFSYEKGDRAAIQDMDLSVEEGEYLGIIGANASGKSTLVRLLGGLLIPSKGEVCINGISTKDEKEWYNLRGQVGIVFQNPDNQLVAPVVEEDVAFGPENLGLPPATIRKRVDEALKMVGMEDYRDYAPHLLSGGQKQRVAIAGVLAMRPKILILDEPTSMLDPEGRFQVLSTLTSLWREGLTVIISTHFLEEITHCQRVLILNKGSLVKEGSPGEILGHTDLEEYSLEVPSIQQLIFQLKGKGVQLPATILKVEDLVEALCRLL